MQRECVNIPVDVLAKKLGISYLFENCSVEVYVDKENKEEILKVLLDNEHKFRKAFYFILRCQYENDVYGKESIDEKTRFLTAIKLKGRTNIRIYCKEYFVDQCPSNKKVVLIGVYYKKTQKIDKKLKSYLHKISEYEYKI